MIPNDKKKLLIKLSGSIKVPVEFDYKAELRKALEAKYLKSIANDLNQASIDKHKRKHE